MRAEKDLPDISPEQAEPIPFDFGDFLPTGVTLIGTPSVAITVSQAWVDGAVDGAPQGRAITSPAIGTVLPPDGTGVTNTAIIQMFGGGVHGIIYKLQAVCQRSDNGIAEMTVHMKCVEVP